MASLACHSCLARPSVTCRAAPSVSDAGSMRGIGPRAAAARRSVVHRLPAFGATVPAHVPIRRAVGPCFAGEEEGRGGSVDINGLTPEGKAGQALTRLFTFVACRTIMAEIEGYDNEGGSAQSHPVWKGLETLLVNGMSDDPVMDLMKSDDHDMRMTGVRVLEVRTAIAEETFDWEKMRRSAVAGVAADRDRIMKEFMGSQMALKSMDEIEGEEVNFNWEQDL